MLEAASRPSSFADSIQRHRGALDQLVPAGQFGRQGPGSGGVWVATLVHL
jgi:hypothetical protein